MANKAAKKTSAPKKVTKKLTSSSAVVHPLHYGGKESSYEVIKVLEAWDLGFHLGNTVKYIARAGKKSADTEIQDLEKAQFYLQRRIANLKIAASND